MSVIKRVFQQCIFQVDQALESVEDHQAVIKSALKEQERVINEARFQAHCLETEIQQVEQSLAEKQHQCENWQRRAEEEVCENEERAMQCLLRKESLEEECVALEKNRAKLRSDFRQIEQTIQKYINAFKQQQDKFLLMKAQSASVDVQKAFQSDCLHSVNHIDDSFSRWEEKLFKQQSFTQPSTALEENDDLDEAFKQKEKQERLQKTIQEMKSKV